MCSLFKGIFRIGAVGLLTLGVIGGGALLIAGPGRTKAMVDRVQTGIQHHIDQHIDDPTAMRAQLEKLEAEYPERIAAVRGDLAELREQIRQLQREAAVSERVVAMAEEDLAQLQPALDEATAQRVAGDVRSASVRFGEAHYTFERASAKVQQIRNTRNAYSQRAADAEHDLVYLENQATRLEDLLVQLETERAQFQSQLSLLSRQVDAIARNERLIGLMEERNKTIEECSRYDAISLDQLTSRLAEVRSRQEAELEYLSTQRSETDYEDMARMQIDREGLGDLSDLPVIEYSELLVPANGVTR